MAREPSVTRSVLRVLRSFAAEIRLQRGLLMLAFAGVLVSVGLRLLEPWPLKIIVDALAGIAPPALLGLASLPLATQLALVAAATLVLGLGHAGAEFGSKLAVSTAVNRVLVSARACVFDHLQRMKLGAFDSHRSGDLSNRLTVDFERLRLAATNNSVNLAVNLLTLVGMTLVMAWINLELAFIAFASLPFFWLLTAGLTRLIARNARLHRASDGVLSADAVESLSASRLVRGLRAEDAVARRFDHDSRENLRFGWRGTLLKTLLRQGVVLLFAVLMALVLWRAVLLALAGTITAGDLVVFVAYLRAALEKPMQRFTENLSEIARGAASGERLLTLLDEPLVPPDQPGAAATAPVRGEIRFEHVSYSHPGGTVVLQDASFTIAQGESVALTGPSGGGKSTVLGLLLRLYEPSAGRILVDGVDLRCYSNDALRTAFAVAPQDGGLFALTVRENLELGGPPASDAQLTAALVTADAKELVAALPGGLDAKLDQGGANLSGGQRQRLSLARAALRNAPVLLLDEPTSALDSASRAAVATALARLSVGRTVLTVTHRAEEAEACDRILQLVGGRVVPLLTERKVAA